MPKSMSTFEKLLHKDNKMLNRMQNQAKTYISTTGSMRGDSSRIGSAKNADLSRLGSAQSEKSLPELLPSQGRIGSGGLRSARMMAPKTGNVDVRSSASGRIGGPGLPIAPKRNGPKSSLSSSQSFK